MEKDQGLSSSPSARDPTDYRGWSRVDFWHDYWVSSSSFASLFPSNDHSHLSLVAALVHRNTWSIPPYVRSEVHIWLEVALPAIPPPNPNSCDWLIWRDSSSGNLSLATAWDLLRSRGSWCDWHKVVWHKLMQPNTSFFAWRLCHKSTPTFVCLQRLGFQLASACPLCLGYAETDSHLFFHCPVASQAWRWLLGSAGVSQSSLSSSSIWCSLCLGCNVKEARIMGVLMLTMMHSIWKARNSHLHRNIKPSTSSIGALFTSKSCPSLSLVLPLESLCLLWVSLLPCSLKFSSLCLCSFSLWPLGPVLFLSFLL